MATVLPMAEYGRSSSTSLDTPSYRCPKCDCGRYETGQIRVSGGVGAVFLMLVIDVSALFHASTVDTQNSISGRFLEFNNFLII